MSTLTKTVMELLQTTSVQVVLAVGVLLVIIKICFSKKSEKSEDKSVIKEEPMPKQDFTIAELKQYDGINSHKILIAVNGKVYDVSTAKSFYGPDGPYNVFAGRDASRALATFSMDASVKEEYDDLSDLNSMQMESVIEWEMQFKEKYPCVGKLLRPGEKHTNYNAEESEDEAKQEGGKKND